MDRQTDKEVAESLLMDWYRWTKLYKPNLGAPKCSPACRGSVCSRQWDTETTIMDDLRYKLEMEAVDYCMDAIEVPMQQAIGIELKNREAGAKVWRCPGATSYTAALDAVMVVMRKKGLFD